MTAVPIRFGLTVDWDFFLSSSPSDAYDCPAYELDAWVVRNFPQTLDPFWKTFWSKLPCIFPSAGLVTRSHIDALPYFTGCDVILNFDQHSDLYGLPQEHPHQFSSGSWLCALPADITQCARPGELASSFQNVRGALDKRTGKLVVDRLHICRSDPWSHPQYDAQFRSFLGLCPCPLYVMGLADHPREFHDNPSSVRWTTAHWADVITRCVTFYRFL